MKAILINPFEKSVQYIETEFNLDEIYRLVGEDGIDFCAPFSDYPNEGAYVGDTSALRTLPFFIVHGFPYPLHGKTLIFGVTQAGQEVSTKLSVEEVYDLIEFE